MFGFGKYSTQIPKPPAISGSGNYIKPKPIFVMKFRNSISDYDFKQNRDSIYKSGMADEYHIITLMNDKDKDEFEMYNADKIERQDWNGLINNIIK